MARRFVLGLLLAALVAAPAGADNRSERKQAVDAKIARLNAQVAGTKQKEAAVLAQIGGVTSQIRVLERQVGDVSIRLAPLERELELREIRLNRLNALFRLQSDRLSFLRRQYAIAVDHLSRRLVAIYENEAPDTLSVLLSAATLGDVFAASEYSGEIVSQDRQIAGEVGSSKQRVHAQLVQTRAARVTVLHEARIVAVRVHQVRLLRDSLVSSRDRLAATRAQQRVSLASLTASERGDASEIDALQKVSDELARKIRAAESAGPVDVTPSQAGLVWPVSGPITSPFGWRWGRMHEGIDIGVGYGTPIHAAAAGTVIWAGWLGGYGNLVVIDHGGGISTAYGHQERLAVSQGQHVARGDVVGYVGCTGHCFGPHLHFEVRINGQAVDPLGYL